MRIIMRDRRNRRIVPLVGMIRMTKAKTQSYKIKNHNKMQIPVLKKKKMKPLQNNKSNTRPKSYKKKLDQRSSTYLANMEWTQTF